MAEDDDKRPPEESQQRLKRILAGAFDGCPTPLKDIPTEKGRTRRLDVAPSVSDEDLKATRQGNMRH